jgi:hypothetical protein
LLIYFSGAESRKWAELLEQQKAQAVSVSFVGISRRPDYLKPFVYPGNLFIDSGAYTFNRADSEYEFEDAYEMAAKYMEFVRAQIDTASLVSEFDAKQLGLDVIREMRSDFYDTLPPEKFMPVWHPEYGKDELEDLCSSYSVVGVCQSDIHGDTENVSMFNSMISRYHVRLHGVGITSTKMIKAVKWDSVSSASWLTVSKFGDTQLWTGRELKRFPKDYKHHRVTYRTYLNKNGFDAARIEADDSTELLKLAIWSWEEYVKSVSKDKGVTKQPANSNTAAGSAASSEVATRLPEVRTEITEVRQTVVLPIMANAMSKDTASAEVKPVLVMRSESMRICDSCHFKDNCPGFKPNANCLYNIPVEIRTKDQLRALHDSLIEMQTQRVLFMKMGEDMEGGFAGPELSSEIDRLNRLIKSKLDGDKNTFSMSMNVSEGTPKPNFMERMLGAEAASKLKQLDAPVNPDDIIEAEIVS